MINKLQEGQVLNFIAGTAYASGDVVVVGNRVGIATAAIASGATGAVEMTGIYSVTKVSAQAWAVGDAIYWDASDAKFTTVGTANTFAGYCTEIAANPTSTGKLNLSPGYKKATVIAAITTADGSDAATTQALANATKASVNTIIAALKVAGLMDNA